VASWVERLDVAVEPRGLGLLAGVHLADPAPGRPTPAAWLMAEALRRGVLVLPEGPRGEVLALTPPAVITAAQLDAGLDVVEALLDAWTG
jgi:4-aminobutyrate aminotransferase/(S)-3-amino-2-methylpropionate transaminase